MSRRRSEPGDAGAKRAASIVEPRSSREAPTGRGEAEAFSAARELPKLPEDPEDPEEGLGHDPLAAEDPLVATLYGRPARRRQATRHRQPLKEGQTWRLVTFSFYEEDVARLDALLALAKQKGHRRVSRSQIVRLALRQVDLDHLPDIV